MRTNRRTFLKAGGLWIASRAIVRAPPSLSFYGKNKGCNFATNAATTAWVARTTATPDSITLNAANCFWNAMQAAGLATSIIALNFFPHDSVDGSSLVDIARYAYIKGSGLDPWGVTTFAQGDLTVNGLKGDGSAKYLITGLVPSTIWSAVTNAGITIYLSAAETNGSAIQSGSNDGATSNQWLVESLGSGDFYFAAFDLTNALVHAASVPTTGYFSSNRSGTTASIFGGDSVNGHRLLASGTVSSGVLANHAAYAFGSNNNGTAGNFAACRMSFIAYHTAYTLSQSATFFNLVQNLLINKGGGWV